MPGQNSPTNPQFPLNNAAYDLIAIMYNKSKAIEAYEEYLRDVQGDTSLIQALIEMRHDDQRHLERLKGHLGRLLHQ